MGRSVGGREKEREKRREGEEEKERGKSAVWMMK